MNEPSATALLVEDEPQIRRFVRAALEDEGWQIFESATMQRGLIDAGTRRPDLIVLDLGLPDGDGIDFIADIRKWSAVPIIVLSARVDEQDKIRALDAGGTQLGLLSLGVLLALRDSCVAHEVAHDGLTSPVRFRCLGPACTGRRGAPGGLSAVLSGVAGWSPESQPADRTHAQPSVQGQAAPTSTARSCAAQRSHGTPARARPARVRRRTCRAD